MLLLIHLKVLNFYNNKLRSEFVSQYLNSKQILFVTQNEVVVKNFVSRQFKKNMKIFLLNT